MFLLRCGITWLILSVTPVWAAMGDDPLKSPLWTDMKKLYLGNSKVVFDNRVVVSGPAVAEDSMNVPIGIAIKDLPAVKRVLVIADLNPIVRVLEYYPENMIPTLHFRMKLQQGSPVRALAQTVDGVWHVGGIWIDAAGGGCTAPSVGRSTTNWQETLGRVQTRTWSRGDQTRIKVNVMHPMDTGLAPGIPSFHIERLRLVDAGGREWMRLDTYEPVSENPVFSFDFAGEMPAGLTLVGRDNNGNLISSQVAP
jgi:sulfur-oxidizing protein SoxY